MCYLGYISVHIHRYIHIDAISHLTSLPAGGTSSWPPFLPGLKGSQQEHRTFFFSILQLQFQLSDEEDSLG